jgi:hypothetical protein
VIPATSGGVDQIYMIVRRTINGSTMRYVEQLGDFFEPADPDAPTALGAWFLDCALYYEGAPIKTLTSLVHLEGQEVGVFADGAMQSRKTVAGGTIVLDRAASKDPDRHSGDGADQGSAAQRQRPGRRDQGQGKNRPRRRVRF